MIIKVKNQIESHFFSLVYRHGGVRLLGFFRCDKTPIIVKNNNVKRD